MTFVPAYPEASILRGIVIPQAIADFRSQHRQLRRATIAGDVPVSIDGRQSRNLKKEAKRIAEAA